MNISKYDGVAPNDGENRSIPGGPIYDMEEILALAKLVKLKTFTEDATTNIQDLKWGMSDVADLILQNLPNANARFIGSVWCDNGKFVRNKKCWAACDAYSIRVVEHSEESQAKYEMEYYLKIGITGTGNLVLIASCHPSP